MSFTAMVVIVTVVVRARQVGDAAADGVLIIMEAPAVSTESFDSLGGWQKVKKA